MTTPFYDFPKQSAASWKNKIEKDLKGKPYENLIFQSEDGFSISPDQFQRPNQQTSAFRKTTFWKKGTLVVGDNPSILRALQNGMDTLLIDETQVELDALLKNVQTEIVTLYFNASKKNINTLKTALLQRIPIEQEGGILICPQNDQDASLLIELTKSFSHYPNWKTISINGNDWRMQGATPAQELAICISMAVGCLDDLSNHNIDIGTIFSKFHFTLGVGSDYFMEMAKIRAFRLLWKRIQEAFECATYQPAIVAAIPCSYYFSNRETDNNILRLSTMLMSGILGGADEAYSIPYTNCDVGNQEHRISRNIQHILQEESYLNEIDDPASGAYYIEQLTHELAKKAWELFQEIEANGGTPYLTSPTFRKQIEVAKNQRIVEYENGDRVLLAENKYFPPTELETPSAHFNSIANQIQPKPTA